MYANGTTFDRASVLLKETLLVTFFAALTGLAAQFAIRLSFSPVPATLQVLVVIAAGLGLGARRGFYSQLGYLAAGAMGMPVFAGGAGGVAVLLGPTGGYLMAFPLAAFAAGIATERLEWARGLGALWGSLLAIGIIYGGGSLWLAAWLQAADSQPLGAALAGAWKMGVAPFFLLDLVKAGLATAGVLGGRLALARFFGEV
jgi:biotin transport system substrate-specific component